MALELKIGIMTPVHFVRMIDRDKVEVGFGKQLGVASIPAHINASELSPDDFLDAKITRVWPNEPGYQFKAEALNVIDNDMRELMLLMLGLHLKGNITISQTLGELRDAIGKNRVPGKLLEISKCTRGPNDSAINVVIGYKNLRAFGKVAPEFKGDLENIGRNGKVILEILAVNPDERAADNFRAKAVIEGAHYNIGFVIGWEEGAALESKSSDAMIESILKVISSQEDDAEVPSEAETDATSTLSDMIGSGEYGRAAKYLLAGFDAKAIANIRRYYYSLMKSGLIFERDEYIYRILQSIAEQRINVLQEIGDHFAAGDDEE